jgi:hypothetical protein
MLYKVDLIDKEFKCEHNVLSGTTAVVSFFDAMGNTIKKQEFAYLDNEQILKRIRDYDKVQIHHAYVKDMNLSELRSVAYERIYINSFDADKCFFDGETDLSICEVSSGGLSFTSSYFGDGGFDIRGSKFIGGRFVVEECIFGYGNKNFCDCRFGSGHISFMHTNFGDGGVDFSRFDIGDADINFSNMTFGKGIKVFRSLRKLRGNISFRLSDFGTGDVDFIEADFGSGNVDMRSIRMDQGDLNFGGSQFHDGDIDFSGARIRNGMVGFSNVHFGNGNIYFIGTQFHDGNVFFSRAQFGDGDISFIGTEFGEGSLDFNDCRFGFGYLNFNGTRFGKGDIDFSRTDFGQYVVIFSGCDFDEGKVIFFDVQAEKLVFSEVEFSSHVYLNLRKCSDLVVENCIIEKTFDLRPEAYEEVYYLSKFDIRGTKNLGHIYVDWSESGVKEAIYNQEDSSSSDKASQFRLLKENFRNIGQYGDEDLAYVEFKRCEMDARYSSESIRNRARSISPGKRWLYTIKEHMVKIGEYILFDRVGGYGTKPLNVFVTMVLTMLGFTLIYALPHVDLFHSNKFIGYDKTTRNFILAFYHSVETFLTIGYGDVNPDTVLGTVISAVEGFCGVFLMSYFTVTVVRKLLR